MKQVIDIGAHCGAWTRLARKYFPEAAYVLVEPQARLVPNMEDLIADPRVKLINNGVSDQSGVMKLALPERADSASFRAEAVASHPTIEVEVVTLDIIVSNHCPVPEICKIDAEGLDVLVLRGAKKLLGVTEVFLVEAAVCAPGMENTFEEVLGFMSGHGYRLFGITDTNDSPRDGALWLVEAVFVRADSEVWSRVGRYQ